MAAVTLTTLRARARERADLVGSSFVTDTADSLDAMINEGVQELHELLADKLGEEYLVSTSTITTAGTTTEALPSDFYKLLAVDYYMTATDIRDLKKYTLKERNVYRNSTLGTSVIPPRYRIMGSNISFLPAPPAGKTVVLHYVPTIALLNSSLPSSSSVNFPNGWERYVVLRAAISALKKEESDTSALEMELADLRSKIEASASNRDAGTPNSAVDTEADDALDPYACY